MTESIHNPHDVFFRNAMSDVRVAREFFQQHLPQKILQQIDLNSLNFQKESFIDEDLKTTAADILYTANFKGSKAYLYTLVEHQSSVDKWIAFRLLCYMVRILRFHHSRYPNDDLPIIYPLIFYNGVERYTGTTELFALFGEHKELIKTIFNQPFALIDSQKIQDEELRQYQWAGIMEFVLKHRFLRNFLEEVEVVIQWVQSIEAMGGFDYAVTVIKYIFTGLEGNEVEVLVQIAKTNYHQDWESKQ